MNVLDLVTNHKTQPPHLSPMMHTSLIVILLLIIFLSFHYYKSPFYQRFFRRLQLVQLLALYTWYALHKTSLAECLPLYHCRLAMFVLLFASQTSLYKQYFALLGVFGSIAAICVPVFDPFPFPHLTILSFIIGHYALLGNCLIYLLHQENPLQITERQTFLITFTFNFFLEWVNFLTHGGYGFLMKPPIIGNQGLVVNYFLISLFLSLSTILMKMVFVKIRQAQSYQKENIVEQT